MKSNIGYIYRITSPSGRVYIGQTTNPKTRFRHYKNLLCKTQPKLHRSFLKYGYENHKIDIIDECNTDILNELEMSYIKEYNSMEEGLNCTEGGDISFGYGENHLSKRPEMRKLFSEIKKEYYKNNIHPSYGVKRSQETIDKIRYKRSLQVEPVRCVMVLDLETGIFYDTIKSLSNVLEMKYKAFFYRLKYTKVYENKYLLC